LTGRKLSPEHRRRIAEGVRRAELEGKLLDEQDAIEYELGTDCFRDRYQS